MNDYQTEMITRMAKLMFEQMPTPGMSSTMSGASQSQMATSMPDQQLPQAITLDMGEAAEEEKQFDPEHIKAAQELVALVGGADRARELIDKVDEAMEVFDDNEDNVETIDLVASMIPDAPDMPMMHRGMQLSSLFNPNAGSSSRF